MRFTVDDLRAIMEEYPTAKGYRRSYLELMWEIAKEEFLHVQ